MTATEFADAASFMLDFTTLDMVNSYARALSPGVGNLAGGIEHVMLTYPALFLLNGHDEMELELATPEIFSSLGDVDELLRAEASNTEDNSDTYSHSNDALGSMNPVASGNEVDFGGLVGDVNTAGVGGDLSGLNNSGDLQAGNVAGNGVTDVVGDTGQLGDLQGIGDVTSGFSELGGVAPEISDVSNDLPIEGPSLAPETDLHTPVTGASAPIDGTTHSMGTLADLGNLGL